jgi:hypothetical protein
MVDSPRCIVLLGSNRNGVGSMSRCKCRCNCLGMSAWVGALVGNVSLLATTIAPLFRLHWVLSSLGPLNILISISRTLETVGVLNDLMLWNRKPLYN